MHSNDEIGKRIRRIETDRIIKTAFSTRCADCPLVGIPSGALAAACCDRSSENYHKRIGEIMGCRRWKR